MFRDRREAGRLLAEALSFLKGDKSVVVLAIPRGGVPVADQVARALDAPLDLVITRKIGAPGNPELAIGAVTQDGDPIVDQELVRRLDVPGSYISKEADRQSLEVRRRLNSYRGDLPYPRLDGKTVVIVDDGLATGSTVEAAIRSVKSMRASSVILAVPVGPSETVSRLSRSADRVVCLAEPEPFYAIGQFYDDFGQVDDETVRSVLRAARARS